MMRVCRCALAIFFCLIPLLLQAGSPHSERHRIVSLSPTATEFLFALGLGDHVVGVTTYCDRPDAAKRITKVGGFADPQLEAIIRLRPTLVVANPFGQTKSVVSALTARKIAVVAQPVDTLGQMRSFLLALAQATGAHSAASKLQSGFDKHFATFKNKLSTSPKVLFLLSSNPIIAASPATFPGEILAHIGARNAVSQAQSAWPMVSLEDLLKHPPDIIVVSNGEQALDSTRNDLKRLLSKYPSIRLFVPKQTLLQRPGPYLNDEIEVLVEGIHNRLRADLSCQRPVPKNFGFLFREADADFSPGQSVATATGKNAIPLFSSSSIKSAEGATDALPADISRTFGAQKKQVNGVNPGTSTHGRRYALARAKVGIRFAEQKSKLFPDVREPALASRERALGLDASFRWHDDINGRVQS